MENAAANGLSSMLDRLRLDPARIDSTAAGVGTGRASAQPLGEVIDKDLSPQRSAFAQRVRVPLGVIGII